ncbi:DUF2020 domain-containing protein [Actinoalloteichus hymeniacidonis]|uniref:DUF2020 family protein n=1 Tax=Actinoalloteichus hymeniacidonis TaxID=340345 RepID=A0AAC9HKE9_9PSEU|nr:DUF2020 domain-containing protein [Actinoalloteichus hymeniacidonis]AOS60864.1 putative DUF2020 family protein [Actinoalloteichus hymeniacidonis]MBB5905687.1 hypothetical protein [Actinoalloteichus hymeniacidonis]
MKNSVLIAVLLASAAVVSGCSNQDAQTQPGSTETTTSTTIVTDDGAPPPPVEPVADGPCPYLDATVVEQVNGQRLGDIRIGDDEPHPSCFFGRPDGSDQLTVRVFVGEPQTAKALVDEQAPVDDSQLAEVEGGWSGGRTSGEDGSVFAVWKDETAVVVWTNQQQSYPAQAVVEEVITGLAL